MTNHSHWFWHPLFRPLMFCYDILIFTFPLIAFFYHNWQLTPFIVIQGRNPKYLNIHRFLTWFTRYDVIMRIQKKWEEEHPIYIIFAFTFFLNPTILNNFPYNTCNLQLRKYIIFFSQASMINQKPSFLYISNKPCDATAHTHIYL
jgi:hypothetical protein